MPKTLAEINEILGAEATSDLTLIIADVKAAIRASDAGVIDELMNQRDALKLSVESVTAERDALKKTIADFLKADEATKAAIIAEAQKSDAQKAREAAQKAFDDAKAKLAALA